LTAQAVTGRAGAWSPLRHRVFRALYIAQFASNVGTWMQTVGAQWLMGDLGGGALLVALVQTASALPIFLLAVLAGALGDILDRRRLLLASQGFMLLAAATLAVLALNDAVSQWALLVLTFAVGTGQALSVPSWQAIQPELVERVEIPQAAALNGVNFNVARAVGPAIGGVVIAALGPGAVFVANALSFVGVVWVLRGWRREAEPHVLPPEHLGAAVRAGWRFVVSAPSLRVVLVRSGVFTIFASALWALIPVVAREGLGLGSRGYGLLLGAVGVGAIGGAFGLPVLRARLAPNVLVTGASVLYALCCLVLGVVDVTAAVVAALVFAGFAWIAVVSSLNATAQTLLPAWARARGLAYYTLVFMGGQALGAALWGSVASATSLEAAMTAVCVALVASTIVARRYPLRPLDLDLRPAPHPEPHLVLDPGPDDGPVLVSVEYRVTPENAEAFRSAMGPVGRARRRTGAERWGLFQDGEDPSRFVEAFHVRTWQEYLRQTEERFTVRDQEFVAAAGALLAEGSRPRVTHLLAAPPR